MVLAFLLPMVAKINKSWEELAHEQLLSLFCTAKIRMFGTFAVLLDTRYPFLSLARLPQHTENGSLTALDQRLPTRALTPP